MDNLKINKLSYTIENVEIKNPDEEIGEKYTAFFYAIDGEKIKWPEDEYNPIDAWDVLDEQAEKQKLVILFHCLCGIWECSSIVANVQEIENNIIKWTIKEYRSGLQIGTYFFNKTEYEETMNKIKQEALKIIEECDYN